MTSPRAWIVIPARFASARFPGKPLVVLRGADGREKALIHRVWDAARAGEGVERVLIATDDDRIAEAARSFGAEVAMTPETCANGTERCAAAIEGAEAAPDIVVNLQGDAPLTPPAFVRALIDALATGEGPDVATPVIRCDADALARFRADRVAGRVGGTLAVADARGHALYFSKEVIPYGADAEAVPALHHVGVYAYRVSALARYPTLAAGVLERAEGLEQLRFLEHGEAIACVPVEAGDGSFWEVNNPGDVAVVEAALSSRGIS
ncbi:MAG: 3-deoxy-manno-octulosonate cytidylyltransferase [Paracoccaceae bacterium]